MYTVAVDTVQYNEMLFNKLDGSRWFYWPKLCLLLDKNIIICKDKDSRKLNLAVQNQSMELRGVCVWMIYTCHCVIWDVCDYKCVCCLCLDVWRTVCVSLTQSPLSTVCANNTETNVKSLCSTSVWITPFLQAVYLFVQYILIVNLLIAFFK